MSRGLQAIEPVLVAEKPPKGARQVGVSESGKIVWEITLVRGRNEPKLNPDGSQEWALHPTTAKPLYPLNRLVRIEVKKVFTLEQDGNANLYMQDYRFPTAEELAEREAKKKAAEILPALARAMVDRGITAEQFVAELLDNGRVTGIVAPAAPRVAPVLPEEPEDLADDTIAGLQAAFSEVGMQPVPPSETEQAGEQQTETAKDPVDPPPPAEVFPKPHGPGRWKLSNGDIVEVRTKIEAQALENKLHAPPRDTGDDVEIE